MHLQVNGIDAFVSTGGRRHEQGRPWLVLLHGAGYNHLTWLLQSRALAYDGWNVLAPDLPGHGGSGGSPLTSVEAHAQWLLALMDVAGCDRAVLCGHSMGGLIALALSAAAPDRFTGFIFAATAAAIRVNASLIEQAETDEQAAFRNMVAWGHGPDAHQHEFSWPGGSQIRGALRVMAMNCPGALAVDLRSCAAYAGGAAAAAAINVPTLCVFARHDRLVPPARGLELAALLRSSETIMLENCGHGIPTERPHEFNSAVRRYLGRLGALSRQQFAT